MQKSKSSFTSQLFWGLIPLVVFILAENFLETTLSVIISVSTGALIFAIQYIREKTVDKFLVLDIAVLTALGVSTIIFHSELFLKIKPGFTQLLFLIYLGYILFGNDALFSKFVARFSFGKINITPETLLLLKKNMKLMFYAFTVHTLLLFYAAFYLTMTQIVFISGIGMFIAVGGVILVMFIVKWIQIRFKEFVPIIDKNGNITGKASRDSVHNGSMALHPVVHVHILNESGQIFLQKRSLKAKIQPGKWDTSVGGHVKWNETIEKAVEREMLEETALKPENIQHFLNYQWDTDVESELVFSYVQITNKEPKINPKEAEQGRWWTFPQIETASPDEFTPNFIHEFKLLRDALKKE
ncbi:MAG: NUDIX domain-containing protein [Salinivirgaceae bacterium]|nr:NUDIX domain-containing protein [Salinivirgaceae bacterium]MDY0280187.1 NUDIX domain-containing protein [Salinivirgaceae bacterium]